MSGRRRTVTKCSIILFRQQKTPASVLRPSQSNSASVHFGRMQRAVTSSPPARFFMHTKSCLALSDYINFKAVEKTGHNRDALAKKINLRWTSCQKSSPYAASILLGANHSREQRRYRRKTRSRSPTEEQAEINRRLMYHLSKQTAAPSIDAPMRRPNTTPILTTITTPTLTHTQTYK